MSTIALLVKAAQNNNGRTLEPMAVREVVETFEALNSQAQMLDGRLQALTLMANVMLQHLGGEHIFASHELAEAEHNGGFEVEWEEENDRIIIRRTPVEVREVPVEDDATEPSEPGLALVPEDDEGLAESTSS